MTMLDPHWIVTSAISVVAFLLWQMIQTLKTQVSSLEQQNQGQERELATLRTDSDGHKLQFARIDAALIRITDKLDELIGRRTGARSPHKKE